MTGDCRGPIEGQGIIALVTHLAKAFNRRSTEEMLGMRLKAFMLLCYLRDHRGATQQELAEALLLDSNAVVLLLNELEASELSIRRRDPEDRRRHVVDLTPAGRDALARAEKAREAIEDETLAELSAEDRETLRRILTRALEGLARTATPAPPA
jgi:DNA-binding MarR family transcriptional regulator